MLLLNDSNLKIDKESQIIFLGLTTESFYLIDKLQKNKNNYSIELYSNSEKAHPNKKGSIDQFLSTIEEHIIDYIFCCCKKTSRETQNHLIEYCEINQIQLYFIPDTNRSFNQNFTPKFIDETLVYQLDKIPLEKPVNKAFKRLFDIVFSLMVITLIMSWLYPILGLIIKFSSKGTILFIQKRNGYQNKEFACLKFRTMQVNELADTKQATQNDSRITKIGKILRKTSLDELPQFFNVLMGDMSVVGPRPHMIKHNEFYSKEIEKYNYRTLVKPGITGLAQIQGHRGETESNIYLMKMRVRTDRFYIQNWSLGLDLKIVLKTALEVILPKKHTF